MKNKKIGQNGHSRISFFSLLILAIIMFHTHNLFGQDIRKEGKNIKEYKYFIGTSPLILTSLIPDDNTFFYNLDFGIHLNQKDAILIGADVYQYTAPLSVSYSDKTKYNGHVLSYGLVLSYQRYFWKRFFLMQMINPLVMDYYSNQKEKLNTGFMLLMATRLGYRFDFTMFNLPWYFEAGGEINYWPYNVNVPNSFKSIDNKYSNFVFAPALNIGINF